MGEYDKDRRESENLYRVLPKLIAWFTEVPSVAERQQGDSVAMVKEKAYNHAIKLLGEADLSEANSDTVREVMLAIPEAIEDRIRLGVPWYKQKKYPLVGLFVSALCHYIPSNQYFIPTRHLGKGDKGFDIDCLFWNHSFESLPRVIIDGPIGNDNFYKARLEADVRGRAGRRNARGFLEGYVNFEETGSNTAQEIQGGCISIQKGGNQIALNGVGGTVLVHRARDSLGKNNQGATILVYRKAGKYLCEGMVKGYCSVWGEVGENPGKGMKGGAMKFHTLDMPDPMPPEDMVGGYIETRTGQRYVPLENRV